MLSQPMTAGPMKPPFRDRSTDNSDSASRQPMVNQAIDRLEERVNALQKLSNELCQRLEPVSRSACPSPASNGIGEKMSEVCPLSTNLNGMATRVHGVEETLRDAIERLEI